MKPNWLRTLANRPSMRIGLAVILIIVGLAPIGVPILSDSSWRTPSDRDAQITAPAVPQPQAFVYRTGADAGDFTRVERSDDGGKTWYAVASIPANVAELIATPGDEQIVYGRSEGAVWMSRDGGETWSLAGELPSRPLSLAVMSKAAGAVLVGTESAGLAISRDGGGSWQVVADPTLNLNGTASVAVTALEINPEDETIVYATTAVWLGTSSVRLTPVGTFVSVDGGRLWLQMDALPLNGGVGTDIDAVTQKPTTVLVENSLGVQTQELKMSPELVEELNNADAAVRSSVARVLGLLGDRAAVQPLLDHLNDPDVLTGDRVAEALGRLGGVGSAAPISASLTEALESDQEAVRARAAYGLGLLKLEAAVEPLAWRLGADSPMVARRAAEALASIGTPDAMAALTIPLADTELTPARHAAMTGLELAGDPATGALVSAMGSGTRSLRAHAAEMLGYIKPAAAVGPLAAALQDVEPAVRGQAAWALGEIASPEAQSALARAGTQTTDVATKTAIAAAQQRAEQATVGLRPDAVFGDGFFGQLSNVPATSWTFFGLALVLALALLILAPRTQPMRQRRQG